MDNCDKEDREWMKMDLVLIGEADSRSEGRLIVEFDDGQADKG